MKYKHITRMAAALAAVGICAGGGITALADVTYSGSLGSLSVDVTFKKSGTDLIVTLVNTATADANAPADILTAVFFDITGNPTLSRTSAVLGLGSVVTSGGGTDPSPNGVGGEWAYLGGGGVLSYSAHQGISSAGLGLFGPGDRFPGANLAPPPSGDPDGISYGITSAGYTTADDNGGIAGQPFIKNSVVFTLGGFTGSESDISNITFQYGTAVNTPGEPHFPPHVVPEPTTFIAGALLLLPFGASALRILRNKRTA